LFFFFFFLRAFFIYYLSTASFLPAAFYREEDKDRSYQAKST
jgi:hypothetical protein